MVMHACVCVRFYRIPSYGYGCLVLGASFAIYEGEIPAAIVADLKRHKAEILSLLRPPAMPPSDAPSWWPKKHPAIRREPPFGLDHVPSRFRAAWEALLTQCPPSVAPFVWEAAIYDAAPFTGV
jgi:hypothetical protein